MKIQVLFWNRHTTVGELKQLMDPNIHYSNNSISNGYTGINKLLKKLQIIASTHKDNKVLQNWTTR
jgi:hypothetical protein